MSHCTPEPRFIVAGSEELEAIEDLPDQFVQAHGSNPCMQVSMHACMHAFIMPIIGHPPLSRQKLGQAET